MTGVAYLLFFVSLYFDRWKMFNDFLLTSKFQLLFILLSIAGWFLQSRKIPCGRRISDAGIVSFFFIYSLTVDAFASLRYGGDMISSTRLSNFLILLCLVRLFDLKPSLMRTTAVVNVVMVDFFCVMALSGVGIDIDTEFEAGESRLMLFGMNPNGLSFYTALASACCLYAFFKSSSVLLRVLLVGSLLCCVLLIVFCGSKGGLIFLFTAMAVVFAGRICVGGRHKVLMSSLAVVFMGVLFYLLLGTEIFVKRLAEDDISDGRFELFARGMLVFEQSPLHGLGQSGYAYYMKQFFGEVRPTHNGYLDIAAQYGVIGLSVILLYLFRQGKAILKLRRLDGYVVLMAVYLIFILNFFKDGGVSNSKITWIAVALMIASASFLSKCREFYSL